MKIDLAAFKQQIDPVIVERGFEYWANDAVGQLRQTSRNHYQATVEGTERYRVHVCVSSDKVSDWSCTCPYDFGPVCKHVAAALYAIRGNDGAGKTKDNPAAPVGAAAEGSMDAIVENMTESELRTLVKTRAQKDGQLRSALAARNGGKLLIKAQCAIAVKRMLGEARGRDGFIDLPGAAWVAEAADEFLDRAEEFVSAGQLPPGFNMSCAVLEEMNDALQFADDSNGDIGHCIGRALELLEKLARKGKLPEEARKDLYQYFVAAYRSGRFQGWDWHLGMLALAVLVIRNEAEEREVQNLLEARPEDRFEGQRAQEILVDLIRRRRGSKEADSFRDQHLENPEFRKQAIQQALAARDFKKAESLALEGIRKDSAMAGLVHEWKDWLLKITVAKDDRSAAAKQARKLFLDDWQFQDEYYRIMKKYTPPEQWPGFLEELIKSAATKSTDVRVYLLADIFVAEKLWERLFNLLSKKPDLVDLDHYGKHLAGAYPQQLGGLYGQAAANHLNKTHTLNRKEYRHVCRFLRRMKKLGAGEELQAAVERIKKEHGNRPALLDELSRL